MLLKEYPETLIELYIIKDWNSYDNRGSDEKFLEIIDGYDWNKFKNLNLRLLIINKMCRNYFYGCDLINNIPINLKTLKLDKIPCDKLLFENTKIETLILLDVDCVKSFKFPKNIKKFIYSGPCAIMNNYYSEKSNIYVDDLGNTKGICVINEFTNGTELWPESLKYVIHLHETKCVPCLFCDKRFNELPKNILYYLHSCNWSQKHDYDNIQKKIIFNNNKYHFKMNKLNQLLVRDDYKKHYPNNYYDQLKFDFSEDEIPDDLGDDRRSFFYRYDKKYKNRYDNVEYENKFSDKHENSEEEFTIYNN
jgi:hypothetical protein